MKTKPLSAEIAAKVGLSYHVIGFQDYLASRVLLRTGLLLQGAILASTAVEKNIKALFAAKNVSAYGHLSDWSTGIIDEISAERGLNPDFLRLLQTVYQTRYLDEVKEPVSFSIEKMKFLVELDGTIHNLRTAVDFFRGESAASPYGQAISEHRAELCADNYMIDGKMREEYLTRPDVAEAFYIDDTLEVISCKVTNWVATNHTNFSNPGVNFDGKSYQCMLA